MTGAREAGGFSLTTDEGGNLAKNALKRLTKEAQSQREKDKAKLKKALKRDAAADEFDQLRKDRQAGRKKKRRIDARVGKRSSIFFRPLGPDAVGYFERTDQGAPRLLVLGMKMSRYDKP